MKRLTPTRAGIAAALLLLPVSLAPAADIEGLWLTQGSDAWIEIAPCDEGLCGTIVWMRDALAPDGKPRRDVENPDPALRERPVMGMTILSRLPAAPDDNGVYRGGRIYDPKSGKTYRCKLSLAQDGRLKFRGFLGFSLLGHTTRWERVKPTGEKVAKEPP